MPNLMYLSTFESKKSQDEHWGAFVSSPVWDALKNEEQYKNTVSHIDKFLLHPTEYSDLQNNTYYMKKFTGLVFLLVF